MASAGFLTKVCVIAVEAGAGPEGLLGSSAIDWERCRGARQRRLTLQRAPQPEELGYRAGL